MPIGAGLGVCTVLVGRLGPAALLAGVGISLLAAYAVFTVNYLLYAVFLTDFVVVLLAIRPTSGQSIAPLVVGAATPTVTILAALSGVEVRNPRANRASLDLGSVSYFQKRSVLHHHSILVTAVVNPN